MTPKELLTFCQEPLALFGADAEIVEVNDAFRQLFPGMDTILKPGTPWPLLLSEAVRRGMLSISGAHQLEMLEEGLGDAAGPIREIDLVTDGTVLEVALKSTSDGGFIMRAVRDDDGKSDQDRDLEYLMTKVLEACPTCLTMARIGDGQILYRSPEATALLGKGFNSREHFAIRDERADFITLLLPNARVDDMRITAKRGDGTTFPAEISARLIDYRGDDVIVSSIHDLTEELEMRDELERQRQQVFRSEKMSALGEVLAGVAHELNNPLSIIVGNAQLMAEDGIEGPSKTRVDRVTDAAERCVSIVRAFLSMARDRPLHLENVPPIELLETARDAFEASNATDIDVSIKVDPGLPDLIVDEVQIVQVLTNLLINAQQALEGLTDTQIEMSAMAGSKNRLRIHVTDNGTGIPPDIAQRIFDPLFTTKAAGKGTGIGLALCHRIVAAHGGEIELDQGYTDGARFRIDLPEARS